MAVVERLQTDVCGSCANAGNSDAEDPFNAGAVCTAQTLVEVPAKSMSPLCAVHCVGLASRNHFLQVALAYVAPCTGIVAAAREAQPLAAGASCATACLRLPLLSGSQPGKTQGSADRCKRIYVTPCAGMGAEVHEAEAIEQQPLAAGADRLFAVASWVWIPAWQRE